MVILSKASRVPLSPLLTPDTIIFIFYLIFYCIVILFVLFLSQVFVFVHYERIEHQKLWDLSVSRGHI